MLNGKDAAVQQGPPEPVPAATVVLVRDLADAREVLLLHRPPGSAFAPDAWVFPGGRLDDSDYLLDHSALAAGPSPEAWAQTLGISSAREAGAYVVAALREAWEETGILVVEGSVAPSPLHRARRALLQGTLTLSAFLRQSGLRLASERLRYIAHWITPVWLARRFDTRFFLCEVGPAAECALEGDELVDARWVSPAGALCAAGEGKMNLLPPTLDTLRRLHRREI